MQLIHVMFLTLANSYTGERDRLGEGEKSEVMTGGGMKRGRERERGREGEGVRERQTDRQTEGGRHQCTQDGGGCCMVMER